MGLKAVGVLLIAVAVVITVSCVGYILFSQFINRPHYDASKGGYSDLMERKVYTASPWVQRYLPFLTDNASGPADVQAVANPSSPAFAGKYWLGWKWTVLEWVGGLILLGTAITMGSSGVKLIAG